MMIFSYGDFLEDKMVHHKPPNDDDKLTQEQKWAHKCGKKWNEKFPYSTPRSSDEILNEPESAPINVSEYFDSIGDVVLDISSFQDHFLILTSRQDVYSLGDQTYGKCGIEENEYEEMVEEEKLTGESTESEIEKRITGLRTKARKILSNVEAIGTGKNHSVLVTKRGDVFTFGKGSDGQLGNGTVQDFYYPKRVPFFGKSDVYGPAIHATCGDSHTMVLTKDNIVYGFGRGVEGQLGILPFLKIEDSKFRRNFLHHPAPRSVKAYDYSNGPGRIYIPIVDMTCGSRTTCILTHERKVLTFGEGLTGSLAQNSTKNVNCPTPVVWDEDFEKPIIRVESGWEHFVSVTDHGEAYSAGLNLRGQCGVGHTSNVKKLTRIMGLNEKTIEKIGCGGLYTACLTETRKVFVCGNLPGRWNDYLEMTQINWFEENGYKVINIFCCGKNLFVQAIREEEESDDDEDVMEEEGEGEGGYVVEENGEEMSMMGDNPLDREFGGDEVTF